MERGVIHAGGHHRLLVSPDGRRVLSQFAFTKACLTMKPDIAEDERLASVVVSHLVSDTPTEMHVFLSLLHRQPIYVPEGLC